MSELRDLLKRRAEEYTPPGDLRTRVDERHRRRQRNRRVTAAVTVLVATAVVAAGMYRMLPTTTIVFDQPRNPWIGVWLSTDVDGSTQRMKITAVDGGYRIVVADQSASVCTGVASTMTGIGRIEDEGLVVASPTFTCNDGGAPQPLDPPVEEQLRNYTLVRDDKTDTLDDTLGVQWRRPARTSGAAASEPFQVRRMWPQQDLGDVREAQQKAEAGDPAYAWQVDPDLDADVDVGDAEIFARFLTSELGWQKFVWDPATLGYEEAFGRSFAVTFVRCEPGRVNDLYPDDPRGGSCAPTVDGQTYETVKVTAYQPLRTGPDGIWVIRDWQSHDPVRQVDPLSDAEIADILEPFLQARVDGQGAEEHLATPAAQVPLLYATSDGSPYERFEYDARPAWPHGGVEASIRLYADGGDTVVKQQRFGAERPRELPYYGPTRENGRPIPEPYSVLDGRVTFSAPSGPNSWQGLCCFTPSGKDINGVQGYLGDFANEFVVVVDPLPPAGRCGVADQPVSADELVRSIRSSRNLSVTAQDVQIAGTDAVRLDIASRDGVALCSQRADRADAGVPVLAPRAEPGDPPMWYGLNSGNRARVYVLELPGDTARTVAIAIRGPRRTFEDLLKGARPLLESVQID